MKTIIGAFALTASSLALAKPVFLGETADHLVLDPIAAVHSPELIGGQPATAETYPGVFYTRQGNSRCTGTVIGSRVVATAAHCVSNGGTLSLTYKGDTYSGRCTHHREYRNNSTADWALCLMSEEIPDAIAETVNTDGSRLERGNELVLMGFGCIYAGGSGGNDGVLRVGSAPITRLPSGTNYDIVTAGSSALCYGDSGGPSFFVDEETGKRYQTGINSRGDIRRTSYLSSLHNSSVLQFYRDWADDNGVTICGLHEGAAGCLQDEEPPVELPEECDDSAAQLAIVESCTTADLMPDVNSCDAAFAALRSCVDARLNP